MGNDVFVFNLETLLVQTFSSQLAAAKWLGVAAPTVSKAIKRGHIVNGKYIIQQAKLDLLFCIYTN
jgi:IS30 family transposase